MNALALSGIRVLDLSRLLPGGFCSLLLADYGADVLKVEDTVGGDYIRWAPPLVHGVPESAASALFLALNRNKRSIRIDLKSDAGRGVLLELVRSYDVVLESFRPGVLDRLGVGWDALRAANPRIILCSITGYGQDGPLRDRPGHDLNYLGLVGMLGLGGGGPDEPPLQPAGQVADLGGGALMAAFAILAALRERDRSGQGQHIDVAMADGALSWLALVAARHLAGDDVPERGRDALAGGLVCYRPYACSDGGWVTLGALESRFWAAFCRGVGREDLLEQQFAAPGSATHASLEVIFGARTRAEWEAFAAQVACCLEPVLGLDEALASEHVAARGMVVSLEQPGAVEPVRQLGAPVKLSRTPPDTARLPGPELGQHTQAALREAGYDDAQIAELLRSGAVAGPHTGAGGSFLA